jgi:hypothetical protein
MAIVVHVWTGDDKVGNPYDGRDARTFLNDVLPAAPDTPVQIAHLGGSGPRLDAGTKEGISVLAEAAASPRAFGRSACDASFTGPTWPLAEMRRRRRAGARTGQSWV